MRGELRHVLHPRRTIFMWGIFYTALIAAAIVIFLIFASRIRTYSMPAGAIQLNVPYKTYLVGEPITFTLTNNYNSSIYVSNDCPNEPLAVYRQDSAGTWVRIHAKTDLKNCVQKDRQIKVASGKQQSGSYADWPDLFAQPGKYRIVAYVEYFDIAPYQDFEIIAKPKPPAAPKQTTNTITIPSTNNTTSPTYQPSTYNPYEENDD